MVFKVTIPEGSATGSEFHGLVEDIINMLQRRVPAIISAVEAEHSDLEDAHRAGAVNSIVTQALVRAVIEYSMAVGHHYKVDKRQLCSIMLRSAVDAELKACPVMSSSV